MIPGLFRVVSEIKNRNPMLAPSVSRSSPPIGKAAVGPTLLICFTLRRKLLFRPEVS